MALWRYGWICVVWLPILVLAVTTQSSEDSILPWPAVVGDRNPAVPHLVIEFVPGVFIIEDRRVLFPCFSRSLLLHEHLLGALADRPSDDIFFHRGD